MRAVEGRFDERFRFAERLGRTIKSAIIRNETSFSAVSVVALHGSLAAGLGSGEKYDIDIALWLEDTGGNAVDLITKFSRAVAVFDQTIMPEGDERLEMLNGTGEAVGVRGHWRLSEAADVRIGIHAIELHDVLERMEAFLEIAACSAPAWRECVIFAELEGFIRNYVIEAIPIIDSRGLFARFREAVTIYPSGISSYRTSKVSAAVASLPKPVAIEYLRRAAYSAAGLYKGNPKRSGSDFRGQAIGILFSQGFGASPGLDAAELEALVRSLTIRSPMPGHERG